MRLFCLLLVVLGLTSCAVTSSHQFAAPGAQWQTRAGQLAYRSPKISLIGDVLVRFSAAGDMELRFSKAPGLTLMTIRQDANFGSAEGPLARGKWAGPLTTAPPRLRGWFALREKILAGQAAVQLQSGGESFNLRF